MVVRSRMGEYEAQQGCYNRLKLESLKISAFG